MNPVTLQDAADNDTQHLSSENADHIDGEWSVFAKLLIYPDVAGLKECMNIQFVEIISEN